MSLDLPGEEHFLFSFLTPGGLCLLVVSVNNTENLPQDSSDCMWRLVVEKSTSKAWFISFETSLKHIRQIATQKEMANPDVSWCVSARTGHMYLARNLFFLVLLKTVSSDSTCAQCFILN